jgi:hypothetical protein
VDEAVEGVVYEAVEGVVDEAVDGVLVADELQATAVGDRARSTAPMAIRLGLLAPGRSEVPVIPHCRLRAGPVGGRRPGGRPPRFHYAASVPVTRIEMMGWLRAAVGVSLMAAPGLPLRMAGPAEPDGATLLLMRTIGIRDLVIGLGAVAAARSGGDGDGRRWTTAALASDLLDTVVGLASFRSIGTRDAWAAGGLALLFAGGDVLALQSQGPEPSSGHRAQNEGLSGNGQEGMVP